MFDETYPDPVRVVTVGVPVDDLVKDPNSPRGETRETEQTLILNSSSSVLDIGILTRYYEL